MENKEFRDLMESARQVMNEYYEGQDESIDINETSIATSTKNVSGIGDTEIVNNSAVTNKISKLGKLPKGGKRVGIGWKLTTADFQTVTKIIKDAGIKFDETSPLDALKALNLAKHKNREKVADELANKLSTKIDRDNVLTDVEQAIIQYDKVKAEFSKYTEKIADKIHAINKSVTEKRWKNPDGFNKSNASKYVAWDIKETGEEQETAEAGVVRWINRVFPPTKKSHLHWMPTPKEMEDMGWIKPQGPHPKGDGPPIYNADEEHETANSVPPEPKTSPYPREEEEDDGPRDISPGDVNEDEDEEIGDLGKEEEEEEEVGPIDRFARWLYSKGVYW
jgi:predicted nucleic-acid-binding protein